MPLFCGMLANSADPDQTPRNYGGVGSGYKLVQKIKMGNSIWHVWANIKCENELFSGRSFMKHYMYHFCYEYNMIYLFYVQYDNSMSLLGICNRALQQLIIWVWRKPRQPPIMPTTQNQISRAYEICRQHRTGTWCFY